MYPKYNKLNNVTNFSYRLKKYMLGKQMIRISNRMSR